MITVFCPATSGASEHLDAPDDVILGKVFRVPDARTTATYRAPSRITRSGGLAAGRHILRKGRSSRLRPGS